LLVAAAVVGEQAVVAERVVSEPAQPYP